ncbi:hypothetical protein [Pseudoduganella umbonata]|uniref:Type IV secretory pathway VirB10-like protein n=1 Tax=Pseudoduganella umbonata TaxID=864828 RepID=A0A4V1EDW3_9BURK|nr:hypothetical protein [Pseudoduganella umbonata]MBB3222254.1 type IV secretory pathway VirB10-like protein [Pseudoduganella umbonata]QCP12481.1 hypothetical protein FCL38_20160 [Pseudoduganella umbonata]
MQQTLTYPSGPRRSRLVAGIAVSILLHALLLALWRTPGVPPVQVDERRWTQPLTIRIVPPPPPPEPVVRAEPPPPRAKPDKPAARPAPARAESITAERPEPDRTGPAMTVVPARPADPAEPAPADSTPRFDPDAARSAARAMANDLDTPSGNWVGEKLKKERELQETREARLGRNIANSARPDCKTAYAGAGLLAPLIMLMDKKDSGCKF